MNFKTIEISKTQHGWFAKFSDNRERCKNSKSIFTGFTRHAKATDVEMVLANKYPKHTIFVIGGRQ